MIDDYEYIPNNVSLKMVAHTDECTAMAFNPMGDSLATCGADKYVKIWNFKKMQEVGSIKLKNSPACGIQYSMDTEHMAIAQTDNKISFFKVRQGYK